MDTSITLGLDKLPNKEKYVQIQEEAQQSQKQLNDHAKTQESKLLYQSIQSQPMHNLEHGRNVDSSISIVSRYKLE